MEKSKIDMKLETHGFSAMLINRISQKERFLKEQLMQIPNIIANGFKLSFTYSVEDKLISFYKMYNDRDLTM